MATELVDFAARGLAIQAAFAALAIGAAWLLPGPPGRRLGLAPGRIPSGPVCGLILATLGLSHGLDSLLGASGLRERSALAEIGGLLHGARSGDLALALVALGIAPGVAEELLCRGLVQRSLAARVPPWAAIGVGALLFAGLHGEPVHAAFALLLGLHLGAVAWWTGSTRPAIACHVANNLVAVLLAALAAPAESVPAWAGLASAACAGVAWVWISRTTPPPPG